MQLRGDEGKGKIVDVLCESVDIVGRCQVCARHLSLCTLACVCEEAHGCVGSADRMPVT